MSGGLEGNACCWTFLCKAGNPLSAVQGPANFLSPLMGESQRGGERAGKNASLFSGQTSNAAPPSRLQYQGNIMRVNNVFYLVCCCRGRTGNRPEHSLSKSIAFVRKSRAGVYLKDTAPAEGPPLRWHP